MLPIPPKRFDRTLVSYLTDKEVEPLLGACDQTTWTGRPRDAADRCADRATSPELTELTPAYLQLGTGRYAYFTPPRREPSTGHSLLNWTH